MWQPYASQDSLPRLRMQYLQYVTFDVDSVGNIYICRQSVDSYGSDYQASEGTLTAVKFWVDHRMVGECSLKHRPQEWYPHLLKFSPHFDTLLESRYLVQKTDSLYYTPEFYIKVNKSNLFLVLNMSFYSTSSSSSPRDNTMVFDSVNHVSIFISEKNQLKGFVTVHDLDLTPRSCLYLDDSVINSNYLANSHMNDIVFDNDSNLVFIRGIAARNFLGQESVTNSLFVFQNHILPINNDAFAISFDRQSLDYHSIGIFPSLRKSGIDHERENFAAKNNRVYMQGLFFEGLALPHDTIETPNPSFYGLALAVFDYQGHLIDGIDYNSYAIFHTVGPIALSDSTLYLVNHLKADADFGEHHVYAYGDPFVCVAKYTDTAFMTPYVRRVTEDTTIRVEVVQEEWTRVLYPNPTSGRVTVVMNGRPLRELYVAGMDGIAEPLPFSAIGDGRYAADLTDRPDGAYVLVMVSDDEHAYRSTLILQR